MDENFPQIPWKTKVYIKKFWTAQQTPKKGPKENYTENQLVTLGMREKAEKW